jgi:hypothetical protein
MNSLKFEKFEMKYGYSLPEDFKNFMLKYGGDVQFGSCRFEYPENIIKNLLRIPGEMDFHLVPFGDIGNGDYYCFYRYGYEADDYYVGIWLYETRNFVILSSSFKSFMYKCLLDDYLSTVIPEDDVSDDAEGYLSNEESIERCKILADEFGFDLSKVEKIKNEYDYHKLMADYDNKSLQSLCFLGKSLLKRKDLRGLNYFDNAIEECSFYTAPFYLKGKSLSNIGNDGSRYYIRALKTSLVLTGYSYWEEDFLDIPEDVHREMALLVDRLMSNSDDYFERCIYNGEDPYDIEFRFELAQKYAALKNYKLSMMEYNNAIFCCKEKETEREILKCALHDAREGGLYYLTEILEHDIRGLR